MVTVGETTFDVNVLITFPSGPNSLKLNRPPNGIPATSSSTDCPAQIVDADGVRLMSGVVLTVTDAVDVTKQTGLL